MFEDYTTSKINPTSGSQACSASFLEVGLESESGHVYQSVCITSAFKPSFPLSNQAVMP